MSVNRLTKHMGNLKRKKQKAFSTFVTLGYPNLKVTEKLIENFEEAGVDSIELGFPFSDPLADGPTIQASSEAALRKGVQIKDAFDLVKRLRKKGCRIPIVFFTYINPVLHYGYKRFVHQMKVSGMDALLIPDLPPEEEKSLQVECKKNGVAQVFLVAPTSTPKRMKIIAKASSGFVYYVSLRGVTGARKALPADIKRCVGRLKQKTTDPVMIGFGVSTPEQAKQLSRFGDGIIVGSALIQKIKSSKGQVGPVVQYVKRMVKAVKC